MATLITNNPHWLGRSPTPPQLPTLYEKFLDAIRDDDFEEYKCLVQDPDVEVDAYYHKALSTAAMLGRTEIVTDLMQRYKPTDDLHARLLSPEDLAAENGHLETLLALHQYGNFPPHLLGIDTLYNTFKAGHMLVLQYLLRRLSYAPHSGYDSPYIYAILKNDKNYFAFLAAFRTLTSQADHDSVMQECVRERNPEFLELFLNVANIDHLRCGFRAATLAINQCIIDGDDTVSHRCLNLLYEYIPPIYHEAIGNKDHMACLDTCLKYKDRCTFCQDSLDMTYQTVPIDAPPDFTRYI